MNKDHWHLLLSEVQFDTKATGRLWRWKLGCESSLNWWCLCQKAWTILVMPRSLATPMPAYLDNPKPTTFCQSWSCQRAWRCLCQWAWTCLIMPTSLAVTIQTGLNNPGSQGAWPCLCWQAWLCLNWLVRSWPCKHKVQVQVALKYFRPWFSNEKIARPPWMCTAKTSTWIISVFWMANITDNEKFSGDSNFHYISFMNKLPISLQYWNQWISKIPDRGPLFTV